MRNSLSKLQFLLFALLIFALSGCGASNTTTAGIDKAKASGKITANLIQPKQTAKTLALPAVATVRLKVTGSTIPTATQDFTGTTGGTLDVYPGRKLTVTAQSLDASGALVLEGFATNVTIDEGTAATVNISMNTPVIKAADVKCLECHDSTRDTDNSSLVANYKQSGHYLNTANMAPLNGSTQAGCAGCHGAQHNDLNPAASGRCVDCHNSINTSHTTYTGQAAPLVKTDIAAKTCGKCHTTHNFKLATAGCIGCHSIPQDANASGTYVNDNSGVRSIAQEFTKWSHHVTGVALNDAHCAACHLEGTVVNGKIVVDPTKHMVDARTHLRDTSANTDADFAWDPAAPNHTGMDNYCMSCHDANGAVSPISVLIQKFINDNGLAAAGKTASASNPFGDTISNRYDKMQRPAVVDASSQFDLTNNSHHAVKGPRYSGRTRFAGPRQIASPGTFANNSSATLFGARMTIYDAVTQDGREAFNALYVPLANAGGEAAPRTGSAGLGDDSTLHCGDCHTVGQWKPGVATNAKGELNKVAIGAHGSNNEYLLRNDKGTDERHTQDAYVKETNGNITYKNPNAANLVCFNCHAYSRYGSLFNATGTNGPHAGEYDNTGRCNGVGNTIPFNGYTTGTATDGTQFTSRFNGPLATKSGTPAFAPGFPLNFANAPGGVKAATYTGEQNPDFGNIFGIQCANCHNSGAGNAYGGIHGSKNNQTLAGFINATSVRGGSYIDGMGNTAKIMRFLPGLGNAMYVSGTLGDVTGGSVDTFKVYSGNKPLNTVFTLLPVRDNRTAVNAKAGSYNFKTGGISNDTNWEQKHWKQSGPGSNTVTSQQQAAGAGCYTLGTTAAGSPNTTSPEAGKLDENGATLPQRAMVTDNLRGPSQGVVGQPNPELFENWGGCDDHASPKGGGRYGFSKRILRPVTY